MTKKRMVALILLSVVLLFSVSTGVNYISARQSEASNMTQRMQLAYNCFTDNLENWESSFSSEKTSIAVSNKYCTYLELIMADLQYCVGRDSFPYVVGLINADREIVASGKSTVSVIKYVENSGYNTTRYIDLEAYLTEEMKEQIAEHQGAEIQFGVRKDEQGKYVPTEICFYEDKSVAVSLNNGETQEYWKYDINTTIRWNLYGIGERSYERKYYDELNSALEDFAKSEHSFNGGGGFSDSDELVVYDGPVFIDGEKYIFYYAAKYNLGMRALESDFFKYLTEQLAIMYLIVAVVIIFVALKLYNKSERLNESRKAFTSAAAHELKTPLAVIQNQCECVLENIAPQKNEEYVRSIHDEALRMNGIVSSLLTFNRLTNADKVHKEKCNLSEIVKKEKEKYLSFAEAKGVTLTKEIGEDVFAECNREMFSMAIDNYLSNAIKYATGEKEVKISIRKNKDRFYLEVSNTAEKIDEETERTMWDVFSRKDKARNSADGSTGMGLPICKRIFDLHGFSGGYEYRDGAVVFEIRGKSK